MFPRLLASKIVLSVAGAATAVALVGGAALAATGGAPFDTTAVTQTTEFGPLAQDETGRSRLAEILDKLVQQGVITADQEQKILAAVHLSNRVAIVKHQLLVDAAKLIGITPADLRTELPGKTLAQVAQAHNVSRDALVSGLVAAFDTDIDQAVRSGKITQDQADKLKAKVPDLVNKAVDRVVQLPKPGAGRDLRAYVGNLAQDAAQAIGISVGDLRKELPGKSLAQVAQAHGVTRDTLVQHLVTSIGARIDKDVQSNKLTQQRADAIKAKLPTLVGTGVDRVFPAAKQR